MAAGIEMPTLPFVGFGTLFDADNDGDADLFVANGHILANVGRWNDLITYAQMNQFFVNDDGRFRDASSWSGDGLLLARVSRGSAAVDIDEDGDLDLAVANNVGPATLLRNDLEGDHGWLQISLIGPAQGVGAIVEVDPIPTGIRQRRQVRISGGYLSSDDIRLHFGLGTTATTADVTVTWSDGAVLRQRGVAATQHLVLRRR